MGVIMTRFYEYKDITSDCWALVSKGRHGERRREDAERWDKERVRQNIFSLRFFQDDAMIEGRTEENMSRIRKAIKFWLEKDK
jgi:hypothetical protein